MRRPTPSLAVIAIAIAIAIRAIAPAFAAAGETSESLSLPPATLVPLLLDRDLRPAEPGEPEVAKVTALEVAADVIVGGRIVAKAGDLVDGRLTTVRRSKRILATDVVSESLVLDVDSVLTFCDARIHLRYERTVGVGSRRVDGVAVRRAPGFSRGTMLAAKTDAPGEAVCGTPTTRSPEPLPHDLLPSDEDLSTANPAPAK